MTRTVILVVLLLLPALSPGQVWTARYNGPADDFDEPEAIAVDESGNVYVTGTSWGSGTGNDYATVKYDSTGVEQWAARYDGPAGGSDEAKAIATHGGCVYVTGGSADAGFYTDFATIKYGPTGDTQWVRRYAGPAGGNDCAFAIAVDPGGNAYVTGYRTGDTTFWDFTTVKYDAAGTEQWVRTWSTIDEDYASAIALDSSGNVYVTGSSGNPYICTWDYLTIKYNSAGVEQWVAGYNGPADDHDEAKAIGIDTDGNVYVTGGSTGLGTGWDYATIKYNPSGDSQWTARYDGPANGTDWANAIAVSDNGDICVTGYSQDTLTDCDYVTVKYNAAGSRQWTARYNGPADGYDEARAAAADGDGNVYVTGGSAGTGTGSSDCATVKYDATGSQQWAARYDGPAGGYDAARAIAVDGDGSVYVTGSSAGSGTGADYVTIRYACTGIQEPRPVAGIPGEMLTGCPNPFRRSTTITYHLSARSQVCLEVHDAAGRLVATLATGEQEPGIHRARFPAQHLAEGIYFARLRIRSTDATTRNRELTAKLTLVR